MIGRNPFNGHRDWRNRGGGGWGGGKGREKYKGKLWKGKGGEGGTTKWLAKKDKIGENMINGSRPHEKKDWHEDDRNV